MKIAENIQMLELTIRNGQMVIHPTVIFDSNSYVLIDTGMPGLYEEIMDQIKQKTERYSIILTHQDIDHVGSLPHFLRESNGTVDVYAHPEDKPYIDGEIEFLKLRSEVKNAILQPLSEKQRQEFEAAFSNTTPSNVTHEITDGERLPFGGGLIVIHTPGHTPGHISLYHVPSKTLIAGDAMMVINGELMGPSPEVTPDMDTALKSLNRLKEFQIDTVVCYHGGIYKGDITKRLEELTNGK
jgi:glyoxylase-like metal-dependent hydrolase (beta-lactamase superfamily II)